MPSPQETDKKVRKLASQDPPKGQEFAQFNQGQQEILSISQQQQALLQEQMINQRAQAGQTQILAQAGELAAMSSAGGQQLGAQVARMNPQTQATMAKYGVKPNPPKVQQRVTRDMKVTPQKIVVNNTTYTTTHNDVKIPQAPSQPVIVPVGGGKGEGQGTLSKFKTWISNVFAKQKEENLIREKEYRRKEWSLSRSASRMMRGLEKLGKTFAERLDPRKIGTGKMSSIKMLSYLMTIQMVRKWWPDILHWVKVIGDGVGKVAEFFGWKNGRFNWHDSGFRHGILNLLGASGKGKDNILVALGQYFWDDGSDSGKKGILNYFLDNIKDWFKEGAAAAESVKFPGSGSWLGDSLGKTLGPLFSSLGQYFKDVLTAFFTGKSVAAVTAGRQVESEEVRSMMELGGKSGVDSHAGSEAAGNISGRSHYNDTEEIKDENGKKVKVSLGDKAAFSGDKSTRQNWLQRSDVTVDSNNNISLTNNSGATMRLSNSIQSYFTPEKIDGLLTGFKLLEDRASKDKGIFVSPDFVKNLVNTFGLDPNKYYNKHTKYFKWALVPRDEADYGQFEYQGQDPFSYLKHKLIGNAIISSGGDAYNAAVDGLGRANANANNLIYNSNIEDKVWKAIPVDDPKDSNGVANWLTEAEFNNLKQDIAKVLNMEEGSINFDPNDIEFSANLQDYLFNKTNKDKLNKIDNKIKGAHGPYKLDTEFDVTSKKLDTDQLKKDIQEYVPYDNYLEKTNRKKSVQSKVDYDNWVNENVNLLRDEFRKDSSITTFTDLNGTQRTLPVISSTERRTYEDIEQERLEEKSKLKEETYNKSRTTEAHSTLDDERRKNRQERYQTKDSGKFLEGTHARDGGEYALEVGKSAINWGADQVGKLWDKVTGLVSVKGGKGSEADLQKSPIIPQNWSDKQKDHASKAWQMASNFHQQNPSVDPRIVYGQMLLETGNFTNQGSSGYNYGGFKVPGNNQTQNGHSMWNNPSQAMTDIYDAFYAPGRRQADGYRRMGSNVDIIGDTLGVNGTYYFAGNPTDYQKGVIQKIKEAGFLDANGKLSQVIPEDNSVDISRHSEATRAVLTSQQFSSNTPVVNSTDTIDNWVDVNISGKINKYNHNGGFKVTGDNSIETSCSGMTRQAFKEVYGVDIGSNTNEQIKNENLEWVDMGGVNKDGTVSQADSVPNYDNLKPGDLLFFRKKGDLDSEHSNRDYGVGHVEVYMGNGKVMGTGGDGKRELRDISAIGQHYIGAKRYKYDNRSQQSGGFLDSVMSFGGALWDKIKEGFDKLVNLEDVSEVPWSPVTNPEEVIKRLEKISGRDLSKEVKDYKANLGKILSEIDPHYDYYRQWSSKGDGSYTLYTRKKDDKDSKSGNITDGFLDGILKEIEDGAPKISVEPEINLDTVEDDNKGWEESDPWPMLKVLSSPGSFIDRKINKITADSKSELEANQQIANLASEVGRYYYRFNVDTQKFERKRKDLKPDVKLQSKELQAIVDKANKKDVITEAEFKAAGPVDLGDRNKIDNVLKDPESTLVDTIRASEMDTRISLDKYCEATLLLAKAVAEKGNIVVNQNYQNSGSKVSTPPMTNYYNNA